MGYKIYRDYFRSANESLVILLEKMPYSCPADENANNTSDTCQGIR